jgi:trans-aconitate 2-methyltransferase
MGRHFCRPRPGCVGRQLAPHFPRSGGPLPPEKSAAVCEAHLPRTHGLPAFFRLADEVRAEQVGAAEVRAAYDFIHADYDAFWLAGAGPATEAFAASLPWTGAERVFEAGCGTGFATVRLADRAREVVAVDLSAEMLRCAEARVRAAQRANVRFAVDDALVRLATEGTFDVVFTTWVLGYIPLAPFFAAAQRALPAGGRLAFLVHRENSPREPLEAFAQIVAEDPTALVKRVAFDFPADAAKVRSLLDAAGFAVERLEEKHIDFACANAEAVLQHLLKSGAGTAYYDAVDAQRRPALTKRFLRELTLRQPAGAEGFVVRHDYVACVARRL